MPAPTFDPDDRDPTKISPANTYRPSDPVWVHRDGAWRPGIVERSSPRAVMVTYRRTASRGTGVDTMTARYIVNRVDPDPDLDRSARQPA